jgi:hypothetical protein
MQKVKEIVFNMLCYTAYYSEFIVCSSFLILVLAFGG